MSDNSLIPRPEGGPTQPQPYAEALEVWEGSDRAESLLREYARILWEKQRLILATLVAFVALAGLHGLLAKRVYTAETLLLIESNTPEVLDLSSVLGPIPGSDDAYYRTQYEILRSETLARGVIETLSLAEPEPRSRFSWFRSPPSKEERMAAALDRYGKALEISPSRNSRLVRLRFENSNPKQAARILNAHTQAYIEQGLAMRRRASEEASGFLQDKLEEVRVRFEEAEEAARTYGREHGILSLEQGSNPAFERFADLNARLTEAETVRLQLEADARLARSQPHQSVPGVLASPLIGKLKQDLALLETELAQLSAKYAPGYPRIQKLRAGVLSTRRRLNGEIQNIVDGLETSFLAAKEKEEELRRSVESQKTEALRVKDAAVEYAVLRSDAETSRLLYDGVRERIRETELAADLHSSNVFVVDAATTPLKPSRPKVMRNLALALVLGLLTSVGLAFVADFLDSRVRTTDELERRIGLPSLGVVPELNAVTRGGQPRPPLIGPQSGGGKPSKTKTGLGPDPMVMEAYRTIRTAILLSKPDEPPKTILITSPSEAEGKTTTALNMAAMFAQLGQKTLLIDADLRKPSCHTLLGADNTTGLTEALIGGKASPQLFSVLDSKLAFLSSGQRPPNPIELLASDRMAELLEQFRNSFGFILIDAPPLNPVSDSLVLSRMVDGVVLVADAQSTTRHSLRQARTQLRKAHAKVLGAVLNRGKSAEHYAYFVEWNSSSG